jgi:molybdate transport system permease protein
MNWSPFWLSIQVTAAAIIVIIVIGIPLGYVLARVSFRGKMFFETIIYLPLVLPPTVVGYYLLVFLGRNGPVRQTLNLDLLFTWQAAALASALVGLPLMVQSAKTAFEEIDPEIEAAASADGASLWQVIRLITLPLARRGLLSGVILGGARALGEFGATVMVAGSIPGRTQTLPLAIYDAVQARRYDDANIMVLVMTIIAFTSLWVVYRSSGSKSRAGRSV